MLEACLLQIRFAFKITNWWYKSTLCVTTGCNRHCFVSFTRRESSLRSFCCSHMLRFPAHLQPGLIHINNRKWFNSKIYFFKVVPIVDSRSRYFYNKVFDTEQDILRQSFSQINLDSVQGSLNSLLKIFVKFMWNSKANLKVMIWTSSLMGAKPCYCNFRIPDNFTFCFGSQSWR